MLQATMTNSSSLLTRCQLSEQYCLPLNRGFQDSGRLESMLVTKYGQKYTDKSIAHDP